MPTSAADAPPAKVAIFWDPEGFELDSLGSKEILAMTDGDTPTISMNVRMLSVDTPEVHYPGNTNPVRHDEPLKRLGEWLQQGKAPVDPALAELLVPKLITGHAGTLQKTQGDAATLTFRNLVNDRLARPGGRKRSLMLRAANQPFDRYGRLLAYVAPEYSAEEMLRLSARERATFNLLLMESGWGAPLVIYPSLPKYSDLVLVQQVAREAVEQKRGAWADPASLTGYEFRMCVRLHDVVEKLVEGKKLSSVERNAWIERYCADMTTREIFPPQCYYKVPPYNRLFIWPVDVNEAVACLNLIPGE